MISGWPYTWRRGNLVERLDRDLSNLEWQLTFSEATLKHLPMFKSDHVPLCLQLSTIGSYNRQRRPFCFVAMWLSYPDLKNMVNNSWDMNNSWSEGSNNFNNSLKT
ncbi:uncharacterized protein DS421_12g376770 [Arachis hypogaea]|nr:uncharacterized protein DS421_12g376770 [Arachis hypogaea]